MRVVLWLSLVAALVSCGPDLGTCDMNAATSVVYLSGTPYYAGQALVQQSCAGGFCHAAGATGDLRKGAPHGLNFDVGVLTAMSTPNDISVLQSGVSKIHDDADKMWSQISGGSMPPPAPAGTRTPLPWTDANGTEVMLPPIGTDNGKATVRNWLACGAPVVAGVTGAPAAASQIGAVLPPGKTGPVTATFASIYQNALSGGAMCPTCHFSGGPFSSQTPLDLSSQSAAYASLVSKDASTTGSCSGKGKLVVPGDCANSILYQKLTTPKCGAAMPLGMAPLPATTVQMLCSWINAGAPQQ